MTVHLHLGKLRANCRPEHLAALLAAGKCDGNLLRIDGDALRSIRSVHETIKPPLRGLGDTVARFAKPIARRLDSVFGTHLEDCKGCDKRQAALNKRFPYH